MEIFQSDTAKRNCFSGPFVNGIFWVFWLIAYPKKSH